MTKIKTLVTAIARCGREEVWLVDEVEDLPNGEKALKRSGHTVLILGPEDYAQGYSETPWHEETLH